MYYEEKIINGKWYFRGTPNGNWEEMIGLKGRLFKLLQSATVDERLSIFRFFNFETGEMRGEK